MSTPFMNLTLPSPLVTPGPGWATLLNTALEAIDSHDHTAGQGVPITPAALFINDDVDLRGHGLQTAQLVNLSSNAASLATPSILHSVNGDLVWINANGAAVPITSGNSIVGAPGNIENLASPASAQYDGGSSSFRWFSASGTMAGHDLGFAIFRQGFGSTASTISLRAPSSGVTTHTINLPATLPTGTGGALVGRATGSIASMSYAYLDNSTLEEATVSGVATWRVKDLGVSTAKLAGLAVTTAKIADLNVTTAKIADLNVTTGKLADQAVTMAKIGDLSVSTAKLQTQSVTASKILGGTITNLEIATGGVQGYNLANAPNGVTSGKINDLAVTTAKIADLAVTAAKIADSTINSTKIATSGISQNNLGSAIVSTDKLATGAATAEKITTSFVYATNAFTATNAGLTGREATPWIIATTPDLFLWSQKAFTITVQPTSGGAAADMAVKALYQEDINTIVHLRVKLVRSSNDVVQRSWNYVTQCNSNLLITVTGLFPGGTVTGEGTVKNTNLTIPHAIVDFPVAQTSHYAVLEVYADPWYGSPSEVARVSLYMNNWVLTLSQ